jgi:D-alanyl-D-alanine carboxypeptidase
MYYTKQEKTRQKLRNFARKNFICRIISAPVRCFFVAGCLFGNLLGNNGKKIGVSFISLLLFPVFSSFSFGTEAPEEEQDWAIDFEALDESVFIADNAVINAGDIAEQEQGQDQEEIMLEVEINESGDVSSEDLYHADELSEFLDEISEEESVQTEKIEFEDYENFEFDPNDWRLILINKSHFIPDDYEVPLGTIYGVHQCDERIIPDLVDMFKAAKADGVNLSVRSPYRTSQLQVLLYNNKITKFMDAGMSYLEAYKLAGQAVTIPGASEHEAGLSLDIVSDTYTSLTEGFGDTAAGKWLAENAHYYGFILRYPAEKEYITTIEYEPWHFRYVGVEAATVMYNENLTLEEFWEIYLEQ